MSRIGVSAFNNLLQNYNVIPMAQKLSQRFNSLGELTEIFSPDEIFFLWEKAEDSISVLGFDPYLSLISRGKEVFLRRGRICETRRDDPLVILKNFLDKIRAYQPPELGSFHPGAMGYFSYDMSAVWKGLPHLALETKWPSAFLFFPAQYFLLNRETGETRHIVLVFSENTPSGSVEAEDKYRNALSKLELMREKISSGKTTQGEKNNSHYPETPYPEISFSAFCDRVKQIQEFISKSEVEQVVLSRRKTVTTSAEPARVYRSLYKFNPSPYHFFLGLPRLKIIGASPERLVELKNRTAYTTPIAGSRPRGKDRKEDRELANDLLNDPKEKAEHDMLVNLAQNELQTVSETGSVQIDSYMETRYFSHVLHLVSEVRGELKKDLDFSHLLRAVFPAGTVSGSPKSKALELINEMETHPRGPYAGALCRIDFRGNLDSCLALRTVFMENGLAHTQAGAGIVRDSVPEREYYETEHKMSAVFRALKEAEKK